MEKDALLFIQFSGYGKARHKVDFELQELAKNSFGKRFFVLESPTGRETRDSGGKKFSTVSNALEKNGFLFDPKKIKTIGFGEYLDRSVFQQLFILNMALGMKKPAPYKNSQSRILLKKSVSFYGGYPTPGEIREAKKMPKSKLDKFVRERIANHLAKTRENTKFWTKQFKPVRRKKK